MLFTISLSLRLKNVLLSSRAFWNLLLSFIVWNSTSYVKLSSIQPTHLRLLLPKRPQYRKTVHSTQESITCTILWVGEGYKEMERGHSISGSKRIQRLSQTPLNITSTLDSWLGLNFSPFFSQRNILGRLKHFQHPIFLMKFCILFEIRNCCSLKHDKHKARDGFSDFLFAWSEPYV